jgi:hypothetical protein
MLLLLLLLISLLLLLDCTSAPLTVTQYSFALTQLNTHVQRVGDRGEPYRTNEPQYQGKIQATNKMWEF